MRKPIQQVNRQQVAQTSSLPAPIGGWNARDSLAAMAPTDAVALVNWFPTTSDVMVRKGYTRFSTGYSGNVRTLMAYNPNNASNKKLFAVQGASIYDITGGGAIGSASYTGLTTDVLSYENFSSAGGAFLIYANGQDPVQYWNGTTWTASAITGVTPSTLIHVKAFKQRLWFIQRNTLSTWYLPVSSIAGAAQQLDFGAICRRGGYLVAMGTWTIDGGQGMDDYAVWVTSEGEVIVYQGTDPSQATTFALKGVYQLGTPMGNRCFCKYGGDLLLISKDGVSPMSQVLQSTRVSQQSTLSFKIQWAISQATTTYASNFGWQMQLFPPENMLLLNVPVGIGTQEQYVMNTVTQSWCRFTGWGANCWELFNDQIYFGGSGFVGLAWNTNQDNATNIQASVLQAFSYFGQNTQLKHFTNCRPMLTVTGNVGISVAMNVNFNTDQSVSFPTTSSSSAALWDVALWDQGVWGSDGYIRADWNYVGAIGYAGALAMNATINGTTLRWAATDYVFTYGGVI